MPKPKKIIIGPGPIVIGQAAEFDYSGSQACRSLREEGVLGLRILIHNAARADYLVQKRVAIRIGRFLR